ncbi:hypothetical protein [Rhodoferax sp.]|uniref:hypothetical protein n=1 Tax=Rhodoferax sp. TaxID=50421 RepID=UPI0025F2CCBB|nr:hypothetical protein [Rhodoferax sp.]MCM2295465.1 hypothetical protein [Rhodoferax sp.]
MKRDVGWVVFKQRMLRRVENQRQGGVYVLRDPSKSNHSILRIIALQQLLRQ